MPVREDLRLDSLCTVDGEGGVHCISKCRGKRPLLHKMKVWAHYASKGGSEAGQSVYRRLRVCCPLCKSMRGYRPTVS